MNDLPEIPLATSTTVATILAHPDAHIHLIGIGGAGLSAIATVLLEQGYHVSGSDLARTQITEALTAAGATVYIGQAAGQAAGADLVLISSAIRSDNPELQSAVAAGTPVVKRAQFLGVLMRDRLGIAVAGTHGKTTTTAMIATTLLAAGHDPGFIVGGTLPEMECNARAGSGLPFVIEADEYDRMFLGLSPQVAVVTNVEWDHVDCYPTFTEFADAFRAFVDRLPGDGLLVACADDPGARHLAVTRQAAGRPAVMYGLGAEANWQARDLQTNANGGTNCQVWHDGALVTRLHLRIPGWHNVSNALAALAVVCHLNVKPEIAAGHLNNFTGVRRRFEFKGMKHGIIVVDDYAHHPSEVRATLAAARQRYPGRAIWAVFQPHTYSRTRALLPSFAGCFADAHHVLVVDIYAARERDTLGMHASQLAEGISQVHPDTRYVGGLDDAVKVLLEELQPGDILLTLGAGDGHLVGERVLAILGEGAREPRGKGAKGQRSRGDKERGRREEGEKSPLHPLTPSPSHLYSLAPLHPGSSAQRQAGLPAELAAMGLEVQQEVPLSEYTSLHIGGPADWLVAVHTADELAGAIAVAQKCGSPWWILGSGSNILVSDAGIRGLTIVNRCRAVAMREGHRVWAEAGVLLAGLARKAIQAGLAGLEWAVSVPGTVGGAVVGNAGAHGGCIADTLCSVEILYPTGRRTTLPASELGLAYRSSRLKTREITGVVLNAEFQLVPASVETLRQRAARYLAHRRRTQPVEASAGSIFRNPPGDYAGRLIEAVGLKGAREGQAQFSPLHANFIVNLGGASATDVVQLMNRAQQAVQERFGIVLEPEILLVGEWG